MNTTPDGAQQQKAAPKASSSAITPAAGMDNSVMDVLENTLWNRQLGVMSEEIVAALVCQIFEGTPCMLCCAMLLLRRIFSGVVCLLWLRHQSVAGEENGCDLLTHECAVRISCIAVQSSHALYTAEQNVQRIQREGCMIEFLKAGNSDKTGSSSSSRVCPEDQMQCVQASGIM